jgi:hypothetical protein
MSALPAADDDPTRRVIVEIEEALGPGVEFEAVAGSGLVGRHGRSGSAWLGFDRGGIVDSDDGSGRLLPIVVGLPASTFRGARLEVEVTGGWRTADGVVLLGRLPGGPVAVDAVARVVARVAADAEALSPAEAAAEVTRAHQRHRERRSHARIVSGRAWLAVDAVRPEQARFGTPHSAAEYSLRRLPPRFVRGLEGLLDDDERILYWVERPALVDAGIRERLRRLDRRAALLLLTDRQLVWVVDHAQPNRELIDWGVDVELVPIERVTAASIDRADGAILRVDTVAGPRNFRLPVELATELQVMAELIGRFTPDGASRLPIRRYDLVARPVDVEVGARFGQADELRRLHDQARAAGDVVALLFSPRRPGQPVPAVLVLRPDRLEIERLGGMASRVGLDEVTAVRETLSPLVGRITVETATAGRPAVAIATPAPLMDGGAALVRLARRAIANRPGSGRG